MLFRAVSEYLAPPPLALASADAQRRLAAHSARNAPSVDLSARTAFKVRGVGQEGGAAGGGHAGEPGGAHEGAASTHPIPPPRLCCSLAHWPSSAVTGGQRCACIVRPTRTYLRQAPSSGGGGGASLPLQRWSEVAAFGEWAHLKALSLLLLALRQLPEGVAQFEAHHRLFRWRRGGGWRGAQICMIERGVRGGAPGAAERLRASTLTRPPPPHPTAGASPFRPPPACRAATRPTSHVRRWSWQSSFLPAAWSWWGWRWVEGRVLCAERGPSPHTHKQRLTQQPSPLPTPTTHPQPEQRPPHLRLAAARAAAARRRLADELRTSRRGGAPPSHPGTVRGAGACVRCAETCCSCPCPPPLSSPTPANAPQAPTPPPPPPPTHSPLAGGAWCVCGSGGDGGGAPRAHHHHQA